MRSILFTIIFFLFYINISFAESVEEIETELQNCIETGEELPIECYIVAEEKWDKKLNEVYQTLKKKLPKASFEKLKTAQIAWVKFKEKEKENFDELHIIAEDSMNYNAMNLGESIGFNMYKITKDRTLDLISYLDLFEYYSE